MKNIVLKIISPLFLCALVTAPQLGYADTPSRSQLLNIARQLVESVGPVLKQNPTLLNNDPKESKASIIPDGETLLLEIRLNKDIRMQQSLIGLKEFGDVYISLLDFAALADFPITIDPEQGTANGWFIRESQNFSLNNSVMQAVVKEQAIDFGKDDVLLRDNDIWVRLSNLSDWFDFEYDLVLDNQRLDIMPDQKWPIIERLERLERSQLASRGQSIPQNPRLDVPYSLISAPTADLSVTHTYRDTRTDTTNDTNYTLRASADVLGHTNTTRIVGNDEDKVSLLLTNFSKTSENDDLLGPIKARKYEFGDVTPVTIPLGPSAQNDLGARVTNRNPLITSSSITDITGDIIPGWDVELYRDEQFVSAKVGVEDGFFVFEDVLLFNGVNTFQIYRYGPQGQEEQETRTINVDLNLDANGNKGVYDVSVALNDTETYSASDRETIDEETLNLAASYERRLSQNLTAKAGIINTQEEGDEITYLHAGAARTFGDTLVNVDTAVQSEGAYAARVTGRRKIADVNVSGALSYESEDYEAGSGDVEQDDEIAASLSTRGELPFKIGKRPTFNTSARYFDNGIFEQYESNFGVSTRFEKVGVSHDLRYERTKFDRGGNTETDIDGIFTTRGNFKGTNIRAALNYDIKPEFEIQQYLLDLKRDFTDELEGRLEFEHNPVSSSSETELSLSYKTDDFIISPSVAFDSDDTVTAQVNMRTAIAADPYTGDIEFSHKPLATSGGVSARVFVDMDGDLLFTPEVDELASDVLVEAVQSRAGALSDENGEAFLFNLRENQITDVQLSEDSFPDAFWISAKEGVSIKARPGKTTRLEFPIHVAGEVDGTVYARGPKGNTNAMRSVQLKLYDLDGKLVQSTSSSLDGFYLFSRVPPGEYYLLANSRAKSKTLSAPPPQRISIGYDGTLVYGNDIYFEQGVPVAFNVSNYDDLAARHPHVDLSVLNDHSLVLNFGTYNSRLMMSVVWYRLQKQYPRLLAGSELLISPSVSFASLDDGKHKLLVKVPYKDIEQAYSHCRAFSGRGIECGVDLVPKGLQKQAALAAAN